MSLVMDAIHTLYSNDDFHRFTYSNIAGHTKVLVDIHGMTYSDAKQFINNAIAIVSTLSQCPSQMTVIHGYNHGTALQHMVRNDLTNKHITHRILDDKNPGITRLIIS